MVCPFLTFDYNELVLSQSEIKHDVAVMGMTKPVCRSHPQSSYFT